jgi:hypothetical protein
MHADLGDGARCWKRYKIAGSNSASSLASENRNLDMTNTTYSNIARKQAPPPTGSHWHPSPSVAAHIPQSRAPCHSAASSRDTMRNDANQSLSHPTFHQFPAPPPPVYEQSPSSYRRQHQSERELPSSFTLALRSIATYHSLRAFFRLAQPARRSCIALECRRNQYATPLERSRKHFRTTAGLL